MQSPKERADRARRSRERPERGHAYSVACLAGGVVHPGGEPGARVGHRAHRRGDDRRREEPQARADADHRWKHHGQVLRVCSQAAQQEHPEDRELGKHRYFRVTGPQIVGAIEALAPLAPDKPIRSWRQSRAAGKVRFARTCYDHLAGELGVRFTRVLVDHGVLLEAEDAYGVTEEGISRLREFGVDLPGRKERTRFAPRHVDWSERYHHFAGPLAKATTARLIELGWLVRVSGSRAVRLTEAGNLGLREHFGLRVEDGCEADRKTHTAFPSSTAR